MKIYEILEELNQENGSNWKISVLKKHKDNSLLERVFKMTMDTITYTYGVSAQRWLKNAEKMQQVMSTRAGTIELEDFMNDVLVKLAAREITGNAAEEAVENGLMQLSHDDAVVALRILGHDLKVNVGSTNAMKIWKDLIDRPAYMRCGVYNDKSKKEITFPAILQLKADGTYREAHVLEDGNVVFFSRSGKTYEYPNLSEQMQYFDPGHYMGELTVKGAENRSIGNGLINSDDVPYDDLVFELWDYVTHEEYMKAKKKDKKDKNVRPYSERFKQLEEILETSSNQISVIETHIVNNLSEAAEKVSEWMNAGFEGGVLKDMNCIFENSTSKKQLKMKLKMDVSVRIVGYQEGTPGTRRESTFGALLFATDDGKIKGKTSGFTDEQLEYFNTDRESHIGKIIDVECNDLTQPQGSDTWALSHPRFAGERDDVTETDTIERAMEIREMAFAFKE